MSCNLMEKNFSTLLHASYSFFSRPKEKKTQFSFNKELVQDQVCKFLF